MTTDISVNQDTRKFLVYKHTNKVNNKVYIGITSQKPEKRWQNGKGYSNNSLFYNAIKKYGWENFNHEVIQENLTEIEAEHLEEDLISKYDSSNKEKGYNLKISDIEGHPQYSEESKNKIALKASQRRWTDEQRKMLSESHKGNIPGNKGMKYSDEIRKKFSEAHRGIKYPDRKSPGHLSEEHRKHISEGNKGKHRESPSLETRQKISEKNKGRNHTEEQKLKVSMEFKKRYSIYLKLKEENKSSMFKDFNAFQKWYKLNKDDIENALKSL